MRAAERGPLPVNRATTPKGEQCLTAVNAELISRQRLGSAAVRLTGQFELPYGFEQAIRDLDGRLAALAAPGHLLRSRSGGWTVLSFWQQDVLCMVQLRSTGKASAGLVSSTRYRDPGGSGSGASGKKVSVPGWWPMVASQKSLEWLDGDTRVVTVVARAREKSARFAARLIHAGKRAGLHLSARFNTDESSELAGTVLVLEGISERVSVSLFPTNTGTGIVAHIQRNQNP